MPSTPLRGYILLSFLLISKSCNFFSDNKYRKAPFKILDMLNTQAKKTSGEKVHHAIRSMKLHISREVGFNKLANSA